MKTLEFLIRLVILLRLFLTVNAAATPNSQAQGRIIRTIRIGNSEDFEQETIYSPQRFRKFKSAYWILALRLWTKAIGSDAEDDRESIVDLLIDHLEDKNPRNGIYTPLICAVITNDKRAVRKLIRSGADVNGCNKFGETALIVAIRSASLESANELIEYGVDVNVKDFKNRNALHYACELGDPNIREEAIRLLLSNWADVSILWCPYLLNLSRCDFNKIFAEKEDLNVDYNSDELVVKRLKMETEEMGKIVAMSLFLFAVTVLYNSKDQNF